ncbi:MAG: desulfoferrodoxin [Epulopiscium sp.]|nr:desulfoferrodoxin [Candidatus Epulonipiscium sp.]
MRSTVAFFQCQECGNIVELIKNGGGTLVCCEKPMTQFKVNTVDASLEKHVPAVSRADGKLIVDVGSVAHPMVEEHYIEWIALVTDTGIQRINLLPGDDPKAIFADQSDVDVYAYCNLHGLWKVEA